MKSSISHIISFLSMILISALLIFIVFEINIRDSIIIKKLNSINYYESAYKNIIFNIDKNIVNEEIKKEYKDLITVTLIKDDIKKIIERDISVSHYNTFYTIINRYSSDNEICDKYATSVDTSYINNIFPTREYKLIKKVYMNTKTLLVYIFTFISMIMILELAIYIINKNFKYNKISIISSSLLIMCPFIFMKILGIFKDFFYTNDYYTEFLNTMINSGINTLFIMGLIVIIIFLIKEILSRKKVRI